MQFVLDVSCEVERHLMAQQDSLDLSKGLAALRNGIVSGAPVVAVLGQTAGWCAERPDPVVALALRHAERPGASWSDLLAREALPHHFYHWLAERFERRTPAAELIAIADMPLSAIFTSSLDPGLSNLFSTNGREPEPVLLGNPVPTVLRSGRRPPIFYLFGRSGTGAAELDPPVTRQALAQRRLHHASAMLLNVRESATALGLIVVDGYCPSTDWLRGEDILAAVADAPPGGVIWFGTAPSFEGDDADTFADLVDAGIIVREEKTLGEAYAYLRAAGEATNVPTWDEPELITLKVGGEFKGAARVGLEGDSPSMRLISGVFGRRFRVGSCVTRTSTVRTLSVATFLRHRSHRTRTSAGCICMAHPSHRTARPRSVSRSLNPS